jgi:hypothetical protein
VQTPGSLTSYGPGSTIHVCGTISAALNGDTFTAQGAGTSANPITLFFETGANFTSLRFRTASTILPGRILICPIGRFWDPLPVINERAYKTETFDESVRKRFPRSVGNNYFDVSVSRYASSNIAKHSHGVAAVNVQVAPLKIYVVFEFDAADVNMALSAKIRFNPKAEISSVLNFERYQEWL